MGVSAAWSVGFKALQSKVSDSAIGQEFKGIRDFAKQVASKAHYTDDAGKVNTMNRVKDGLTVALSGLALLPRVATAGVKALGGKINTLAEKKPVLAMSLGLVGVICGGALCSAEPFTGIALLATSVYAMARGLKEACKQGLLSAKKDEPNVDSKDEGDEDNTELNADRNQSFQPAIAGGAALTELDDSDASLTSGQADSSSAPRLNTGDSPRKEAELLIAETHETNRKLNAVDDRQETAIKKANAKKATNHVVAQEIQQEEFVQQEVNAEASRT
jgi:hypothetical protein